MCTIQCKGYGAASLELGVPLTSQSVFYMGSVSKQFTAASVVLAAEKGLLSLDDNVRKYVPELPDYGQPVTLWQMLHHTSGFRDKMRRSPRKFSRAKKVMRLSAWMLTLP